MRAKTLGLMRTRGVFKLPGVKIVGAAERAGVRDLRSRRRTDEEIPGSEREDTGKEVNEGNDEEEVDDSETPTEVTRGGDEKQDHQACCDCEETENKESTCPELPKSVSMERESVASTQWS